MIRNYIGGEWSSSTGTNFFDVVNPANKQLLDKCPLGTMKDVNQAVASAKSAFLSWRQTPATDRVQPLFKMKVLLEENVEELARCVTIEHGKTMVETACGIPSLMMGQMFEDIAEGIDCHSVQRPMGVFTAIAPFNFPAMVPFWFWPFAVACGNTFIIKPSERVPLTQVKVFELIEKAGFPKGVMNMIHGGKEVVDGLCTHPDVQGISFVGSTPVAKHVYTTGCAAGKRVQALGGAKNFMVVLPDAILDKAASVALESVIGCAGERCLAGSVIVSVGEETYNEMKERIVRLAKEIRVGDGLDPKTQMGPVISQTSKDRILKMISVALEEGAELLLDGRQGVDDLPGFFLKPTVLGNIKPHMQIAKEEVFGPVVLLSQVKSFDEAIKWLNSSEFANTTTLFTTSGAAARKFAYEVDPAMIGVNIGVPAPMAFFSFGGTKASFYGDIKAHGKASIGFYTDTKTTILRWMKDSSIW